MKVKKCSKGLTLLEVVISLAILAIIVGPILSLTLTSVKVNKKSDDKLNALNIAQKKIEESRVLSKGKLITDFQNISEKKYIKSETEGDYESVIELLPIGNNAGYDCNVIKNDIECTIDSYDIVKDDALNIKIIQDDKAIKLNGYEIQNLLASIGEIIIKVNLNETDLKKHSLNKSNLKVNVFNYCENKKIKIFFAKDEEDYGFDFNKNFIGEVSYSIIFQPKQKSEAKQELKDYDSYKINVEVKKNGETLQILRAYKIFK